MTEKKPAYGDQWDDRDKRMNRRVVVVSIIDPRGDVNPFVTVRNVGKARPDDEGDYYPSPVGRSSVMRLDSLRRRFRYVEPLEDKS